MNSRMEKEWRSWVFTAWKPEGCEDPKQWFEDVESEISVLDCRYVMALEVSPSDDFVESYLDNAKDPVEDQEWASKALDKCSKFHVQGLVHLNKNKQKSTAVILKMLDKYQDKYNSRSHWHCEKRRGSFPQAYDYVANPGKMEKYKPPYLMISERGDWKRSVSNRNQSEVAHVINNILQSNAMSKTAVFRHMEEDKIPMTKNNMDLALKIIDMNNNRLQRHTVQTMWLRKPKEDNRDSAEIILPIVKKYPGYFFYEESSVYEDRVSSGERAVLHAYKGQQGLIIDLTTKDYQAGYIPKWLVTFCNKNRILELTPRVRQLYKGDVALLSKSVIIVSEGLPTPSLLKVTKGSFSKSITTSDLLEEDFHNWMSSDEGI